MYCPAIDSNVVDQAGEVGPLSHRFARTDVKAVSCIFQTILRVPGHRDAVNVERSAQAVPDKTYSVPLAIGDGGLGEQDRGTVSAPSETELSLEKLNVRLWTPAVTLRDSRSQSNSPESST